MSPSRNPSETAFRVAQRVGPRAEGVWDVFGESLVRYEVHLTGRQVEMRRGPIELEGYGIRLIRPRTGGVGVGFASSTDLSDRGIDRAIDDARAAGSQGLFPAASVELPSSSASAVAVESVDRELWARPEERLERFVEGLLEPFGSGTGPSASFGSVRATLAEATIANSSGIERRYVRSQVDLEFAVKSSDGPEGPAPGEYWVNRTGCRLEGLASPAMAESWRRKATEVRSASPTPGGDAAVVLPPEVLSDIVPPILGFRLGGSAALRGMMPAPGTPIAVASMEIWDDGLFPFGPSTAPWDDEGAPQGRRHLVEAGAFREGFFDSLHAGAVGRPATASARRDPPSSAPWFRFPQAPSPGPTTLVIPSGTGGSEEELLEGVGEGLYLDQMGYAFPDPISGAFGGEIRIGYRIHRGKLAEPVRGGTVGGLVLAPPGTPSLLASARIVGGAPRLEGRLFTPPIASDGLSIAGA